jgi:hypothetical protein
LGYGSWTRALLQLIAPFRSRVSAGVRAAGPACIVAVCAATLYVATLAPGLVFPVMDGHELTVNAIRLGVAHPSGYPLYTWLGFLFVHLLPSGDAAHRMNLMSALLGAAGVGLVVVVGRRLGLSLVPAALSALLLAVTPTMWSQSVMAEVYAPDVFMLALTMLFLLAWADARRVGRDGRGLFAAFALAFGLSLGTHLSNLLFAPTYAVFVLGTDPGIVRRPREILLAAAAFGVGAAQYAWLPLRGGIFDQYPNPPPVTLGAMYRYTFGAFSNLKFAYTLGDQPLRVWFYLRFLVGNFTLAGVLLGTLGTWIALARHPVRFWLLFGVFLTNAAVFAQFAVRDPDAFFLAGYVPWALFVGFACQGVLDLLARRAGAAARSAAIAGTLALVVGIATLGRASWRESDERADTLVGDFAPNAFAMMPPGAFVTAPRGAFGAGVVYWQLAHRLGPDVVVLGQHGAPSPPRGAPLFTTVRVVDGRPTGTGRLGQSNDDLPPDAWYVPVLFGNAYGLQLARVQNEPPPLVVTEVPTARLDRRLGPITLVAATASVRRAAVARRLHVESWWRIASTGRIAISTGLDERTLESHDLGLGNLPRYAAIVGVPDGAIVHEDYDVVVPANTTAGTHVIRLGVATIDDAGLTLDWSRCADVVVD